MKFRVSRETFIAYRLKVNHLDRRLPEGAFTIASASGLQDSGPRGAVLSLHARVHSVKSESWESPEFIQVWGPRSAVYLVPSEDVALFTLGRLPWDADEVRTINKIATVVQRILAGGSLRKRELTRQLECISRSPSSRGSAWCAIGRRSYSGHFSSEPMASQDRTMDCDSFS